ncbi:putative ORFan [Tupanvirus deep ocean]|uniref:ORFan n=2 Tax=Tupanvirus TaxID=2094720 RepID=A0AC62A782_9VIRU|nr:putative ORFan [Tupanvirus deep ocean]QKU33507.1 putative ORFan [Tupanvirus deep ocean]
MTYASTIPNDLISELVGILEEKMEGFNLIGQLFMIQYSYFEKEKDKWMYKNFLDIGPETIKDIYLDINDDDATSIFVYGQNKKYGVLHINKKLDMRNKSQPNKIYACDLYIDFEPEHYIGKCYTAIKN